VRKDSDLPQGRRGRRGGSVGEAWEAVRKDSDLPRGRGRKREERLGGSLGRREEVFGARAWRKLGGRRGGGMGEGVREGLVEVYPNCFLSAALGLGALFATSFGVRAGMEPGK